MLGEQQPFSRRHGFQQPAPEISVRNDAPANLRFALFALAKRGGLGSSTLVDLISSVLLVAPDGNWSADYLDEEAQRLLRMAAWEKVYDCAEAIYLRLNRLYEQTWTDPPAHEWFERELNAFFIEQGIGWQMVDGHIEFRGPKPLEDEVKIAVQLLDESGRQTSTRELNEARIDLSRRPNPDTTGAVQHALAALECLARDVTGNQSATLGDLVRREKGLFPKPLDDAMQKLWGYSSEFGRHVREGREPDLAEAMLVVGLAASASAFLLEREREGHIL
ncbi:hypothetical protein HPQ64_07700 [Rhizobiales bacterium]|uniref:AbiJ-NTD4 domain-containing protein n=1 Tax=Hongsoonwoonella zoysiae TaxID=2821844 RepID=UPI0015613B9F|nr:hypothetical protein [Hongsoonwoonella zoysiae]NRG17569.1 hypothetical protein [Hongsoonwoonella zoysiae]